MSQVSFETPEYTANADAHRRAAPAGSDPHPGPGEEDALLPGLDLGAVRPGAGDRRRRETTPFYPRSPYARRQALRLLDHGELPRGLRHVRLQRHPVQPRKPAAAARPSSPARSRAPSPRIAARPAGHAVSRQPRRASATGAMPATTSRGMWLMLQQDEPEDYVHRDRRDSTRCANSSNWRSPKSAAWHRVARRGRARRPVVDDRQQSGKPGSGRRVDPRYFRPTEVELLHRRSPARRAQKLGWKPKTTLRASWCKEMVRERSRRRAPAADGWPHGNNVPFRARVTARQRSSSPAIAAWSARPSCAACAPRATPNIVTAQRQRARSARPGRGPRLLRHRAHRTRCSWRRPRSAASSPTTPTRRNSSTTT